MASPNIFQSLLRPVKSVADYDADYDMAEGNKLKLAAARMGMEQSQRGAQQAEARRQAFAASGGNGKAYRNALQQIGDYAGVQEFDTQEQARAKGASDLDTADVARRKSEVEIIDKSLATAKTFANQIQTPQQAQAYLQGLYSDPVLGKVAERLMPYEQAVQQIPQDEAGLLRWKAGHMAITGDKLIDLLKPKTDITNMGASQSFGATDQFTGQRTQTGSQAITQSADNLASQTQSDTNNRRSVGASLQNAAATRAMAQAQNNQTRAWQNQMRDLQLSEAKGKQEDRTRAKQAAVDSVKAQLTVIDKALDHPGRETATGLSGAIDPRNYVPGTKSADFQAVLAQINGTAFLQAFESLKGGGQITEVEGRKATEAIARLNRSQSDAEFETSLTDLRGVMEKGYERLTGQPAPARAKPKAAGMPGIDAIDAEIARRKARK